MVLALARSFRSLQAMRCRNPKNTLQPALHVVMNRLAVGVEPASHFAGNVIGDVSAWLPDDTLENFVNILELPSGNIVHDVADRHPVHVEFVGAGHAALFEVTEAVI